MPSNKSVSQRATAPTSTILNLHNGNGRSNPANLFFRRAPLPSSYDPETGTIEAIISTGADVERRDSKGVYLERAPLDSADLSKLIGAPLLDGHRAGSTRDVLGVVESYRREPGQIVAVIRLSQAPDAYSMVQRIIEGTVRGVSVGYAIRGVKESYEGTKRVRTATAWTPVEVSAVPIAADDGAQFRSLTMPKKVEAEVIEDDLDNETPIAATAVEIRPLCRAARLPSERADAIIDDVVTRAASLDEARDLIAVAVREQNEPARRIRTQQVSSHEDPAVVTRRMTAGLVFRAAGGELPDEARPYAEISFRSLAETSLRRAGLSTTGLSADELFTRAATGTSDFPLVVENAANKIALDRYRAALSGISALFRTRTLTNFKPSKSVRLGHMGELKPITEHGEITHTSNAERGESIQLSTFARGINISRQLLIDDDLGLFGDITAALGDAAAATVNGKMADLLINDYSLSDSVAVFHSTRGNLAATPAPLIDADTGNTIALSDARKALRTVKDLDGETIVGVTPKYLVCGPALETHAEMALAQINAAVTLDANPFAGALTLLVEPRISDFRWFVAADPARMPCLVLAYLSSQQGPQIQRTEAWDTLGMKYRCWLDFTAAWTDWRGVYKNAGVDPYDTE